MYVLPLFNSYVSQFSIHHIITFFGNPFPFQNKIQNANVNEWPPKFPLLRKTAKPCVLFSKRFWSRAAYRNRNPCGWSTIQCRWIFLYRRFVVEVFERIILRMLQVWPVDFERNKIAFPSSWSCLDLGKSLFPIPPQSSKNFKESFLHP